MPNRLPRHRAGLLTLVAVATIGQPASAIAQSSDNAADLYREAIRLYEARPYEWEEYVPVQQFLDNPTVEPSQEARAFLGRHKRAMDLYQRASTRDNADFGIDYSDGVMLLLPHVAPMRNLAKLMGADAQVRLFDGDSAGASRRLAGIYGAARHSTQDGLLISSLVGMAFTALAENTTTRAFENVELTVGDARILHRTIDRFDEVDPFDLSTTILGEHAILRHEMEDLLDADYMERRRQIATIESVSAAGADLNAHRIAQMSEKEIEAMIAGHERFIRRAGEIVRMTDDEKAVEAMRELIERGKDGEFGDLAPHSAEWLPRVLAQHHNGRKLINERRDMLEEIIRGDKSLTDFASAAYYYMQAIETMGEIATEEKRAAVRAAADHRPHALDESAMEMLNDLAPVLDLVRQGALRESCDFAPYRPRHRAMLAAPYAAGLHDLARILDLETRRLRNAGDDPAALVSQVVTTIRFASHLNTDTLHMTSAIAHNAFVQALLALESVAANPRLTDEDQGALRDAVARISRTDPFGYGACKVEPFIQWLPRPEVRRPAFERFRTFVGDWSADRWYFLTAVMEYAFANDLIPHYPEDDAASIDEYHYATDPDDLARLADLYDQDALNRARQITPDVMALIREGDFEAVDRLEVPLILNIAGRMALAKRDLARALKAVELEPTPRFTP